MNRRLNVACSHHIVYNFFKKLYSHRDENKYIDRRLIFQCLFELLSRIKNKILKILHISQEIFTVFYESSLPSLASLGRICRSLSYQIYYFLLV